MYQNILVPTDGSKYAARGVEHGMELASEHGAKLHVLFVVDETIYGATPAFSSYEAFLEQAADEAEEIAEDIVEDATERGIDSTLTVLRGVPYVKIVEYAENNDIDIITMGKRGATGAELPHLGSVTNRVLRGTEIPVLPV